MFKQGEIVKSLHRTEEFPKFVMVLYDREPSKTMFNGVVLFTKNDKDEETQEDEETGYVANNWNTHCWEISSWEELGKWVSN